MIKKYKTLLSSIPSLVILITVLSVIFMNLLANKEIYTGSLSKWIVIDCGTLLSWVCFLTGDMITKRFGYKASIMISVLSLVVNLVISGVLFLVTLIPGNWAQFYEIGDVANVALNNTFSSSWYIVIISSLAFIVSNIMNALCNKWIESKCKNKNSFKTYALQSYASTCLAQFIDNIIFTELVSVLLFGWSQTQALICASIQVVIELLCEIFVGPIGYKIVKKWEKEGVGEKWILENTKNM